MRRFVTPGGQDKGTHGKEVLRTFEDELLPALLP